MNFIWFIFWRVPFFFFCDFPYRTDYRPNQNAILKILVQFQNCILFDSFVSSCIFLIVFERNLDFNLGPLTIFDLIKMVGVEIHFWNNFFRSITSLNFTWFIWIEIFRLFHAFELSLWLWWIPVFWRSRRFEKFEFD